MGDENSLVRIIGGRQVYLVSAATLPDHKEGVLGIRKKSSEIERSIFFLYADVVAAEEDGTRGLGEIDYWVTPRLAEGTKPMGFPPWSRGPLLHRGKRR